MAKKVVLGQLIPVNANGKFRKSRVWERHAVCKGSVDFGAYGVTCDAAKILASTWWSAHGLRASPAAAKNETGECGVHATRLCSGGASALCMMEQDA